MNRDATIVPAYQTLSLWDLVDPGSNQWRDFFPFSAETGRWVFSGRVALHLGLPLLELPPGSTVLVPNYFQGVEIDTLLHNGHRLQFYRVDRNLAVDLDDVRGRLDASVSALHIIHYFGWPQDMAAITAFCREHGLRLIEDCALSLFSRDARDWLGTYGDLALFSVYKTLALPHGGFLVTRAGRAAGRLSSPPWSTTADQTSDLIQQHLRATGWMGIERPVRDTLSAIRRALTGTKREQDIRSGGATWDGRLLELGASAWTRSLMRVVDPATVIAGRRRNFKHLAARLREYTRGPFDELPNGVCPLFYPVMVQDKPAIIDRLAARGVGSINLWWEPHPACPDDLAAEVAYLREGLLELPIHQSLSLNQVDRVADTFLDIVNG